MANRITPPCRTTAFSRVSPTPKASFAGTRGPNRRWLETHWRTDLNDVFRRYLVSFQRESRFHHGLTMRVHNPRRARTLRFSWNRSNWRLTLRRRGRKPLRWFCAARVCSTAYRQWSSVPEQPCEEKRGARAAVVSEGLNRRPLGVEAQLSRGGSGGWAIGSRAEPISREWEARPCPSTGTLCAKEFAECPPMPLQSLQTSRPELGHPPTWPIKSWAAPVFAAWATADARGAGSLITCFDLRPSRGFLVNRRFSWEKTLGYRLCRLRAFRVPIGARRDVFGIAVLRTIWGSVRGVGATRSAWISRLDNSRSVWPCVP